MTETMQDDGDTNFKISFKKLTQKYGAAYREYIRCAYLAKDELTDKEFCRLNHLPIELLSKWTS